MALRFIESFDHNTAVANLTLGKWTTLSSSTGVTFPAGRFGTGISLGSRLLTKTLDAQGTWIVGVALKFTTYPSSDLPIIALLDAGTLQTDVRVTPGGLLRVTRNGVTLGTGTTVLTLNVWYYVEFKCTISDTVGVAVVRLNSVTEINLSNQDTKNTANATADQVQIGATVTFGTTYDDIYVVDGTGGAPANDFLGDVRVEAILPSGNGNSSVLVGSDGNSVDNYLLVDEATPNDDTDYVESSTVGDKDTYAFGNLTTATGTVYGVQVLPWARKTDAGARSIVSVARLSATEVDSADKVLSTSYQYLPDVRETKPGGGAWTISDVNSAEFGVKVTA